MSFTQPTKTIIPTAITGLWQVNFGRAGERFWCGAICFASNANDISFAATHYGQVSPQGGLPVILHTPKDFESDTDAYDPGGATPVDSMPDGLFYIKEAAAGNKLIVDPAPLVDRADCTFHFLPYRFVDSNNVLKNAYGIICNGKDDLLYVGRGKTTTGNKLRPIFSKMVPNNRGLVASGSPPPTSKNALHSDTMSQRATYAIRGVNSVEEYMGSVCYGGFLSWNPRDGDAPVLENFKNSVVFSAPRGSNYSSWEVDVSSYVQIGADPGEPVVRVIKNTAITDVMNAKGQLLAFTPRRVTVIDGPPPLPGNEGDIDPAFRTDLIGDIGTWAARSVVKTPLGIVFLGSDGMVYLIGPRGLPTRIGRGLQPHFEQLSPIQMSRATAAFYRDHYVLCIPTPNTNSLFNSEMWMADLRTESIEQTGVAWVGPHSKKPYGVLARGFAPGDKRVLMAASDRTCQVFQVLADDIKVEAPIPSTPSADFSANTTKYRKIKTRFITNPMDIGDIHKDKAIRRMRMNFKTDNVVDVTMAIAMAGLENGADQLSVKGEEFSEEIQPGFATPGSGSDAAGGLDIYPGEGFEPVNFYPSKTIRGRAVSIEYREEPSANGDDDPAVSVSDLSIEVEEFER